MGSFLWPSRSMTSFSIKNIRKGSQRIRSLLVVYPIQIKKLKIQVWFQPANLMKKNRCRLNKAIASFEIVAIQLDKSIFQGFQFYEDLAMHNEKSQSYKYRRSVIIPLLRLSKTIHSDCLRSKLGSIYWQGQILPVRLDSVLQFMNSIFLLLLVTYCLANHYQITTIGYSGDNTIVFSSNQKVTASSGPSNRLFRSGYEKYKIYHHWKFLHRASLGGKAKWITPTSTHKIYPCNSLATYTVGFRIQCSKQPVNLRIASTGLFKVGLNDVLVQNWQKAWPKIAEIHINAKFGENKLKIFVFNRDPSPAAIIYILTQDTHKCFKFTVTVPTLNPI